MFFLYVSSNPGFVQVGVLQVGFQDVTFLPFRASFTSTTFLKNCGRGKGIGTAALVSILWLAVSKGMLPVEYLCSIESSLCVDFFESIVLHIIEVNMATLSFWRYHQV